MGTYKTKKRREQRKKVKEKMSYGQGYEDMLAANKAMKAATMFFTLGSTTTQSDAKTLPVNNGENPMYVDYVSSDKHTESAKTNYLLQRFSNVKSKIRTDLYKQFGLLNEDQPANAQELVDRITSGKYILPTEKEEELMRQVYYCGHNVLNSIKWRDPAIVEDKVGFKAAEDQLDLDANDVHDAIMLKTSDEALAAIKTFESWKPSKSAKAS